MIARNGRSFDRMASRLAEQRPDGKPALLTPASASRHERGSALSLLRYQRLELVDRHGAVDDAVTDDESGGAIDLERRGDLVIELDLGGDLRSLHILLQLHRVESHLPRHVEDDFVGDL